MTEVLDRCLPSEFEVGESFSALVRFDDPMHVVVMSGELDRASREVAVRACTLPNQVNVFVAMADVTVMDCAGYGALLAARSILEERGGSLSLLDPGGAPLRLLGLIEKLTTDSAPLLRHTSS